MKKNFAFALAIIMMVVLSACGSSGQSSGSSEIKRQSVDAQKMTITINQWDSDGKEIESIQREGTYTGEVVDGKPDGNGKFESENSSGVAWSYEGSFKNGLFDGDGRNIWADGSFAEIGHYENGTFKPTKAQFFDSLRYTGITDYSMESAAFDFIDAHNDFFPCTTDDSKTKAMAATDESISYKQIVKNISAYGGKIVHATPLYVTQVFEDYAFGHTVTYMLTADTDDDNSFYYICYDGSLPDVYEESKVNVYGLVLSKSSFENIAGGTTNVVVLAGSIVDLIK